MDSKQFDAIARRLAGVATRRRVLGALVLGGAAQVVGQEGAAAARLSCRANGQGCTRNTQCCGGTCRTSRDLPRAQRNRCTCVPNCSGRCLVDDGCGGTCPGCSDGYVCGDSGICRSPCDITGRCVLGIDGGEYLNPEGCGTTYVALKTPCGFMEDCAIHCESNADCETGDAYEDSLVSHPGNVRAICGAANYWNGNRVANYGSSGACLLHPLETGACWD